MSKNPIFKKRKETVENQEKIITQELFFYSATYTNAHTN